MLTKYRAFERSTMRTTAFIYFAPNPNIPSQIVATIVPVELDGATKAMDMPTPRFDYFTSGTKESDMAIALLKGVGLTDDDLEHRISFANVPA